jgi:hypothetical protein
MEVRKRPEDIWPKRVNMTFLTMMHLKVTKRKLRESAPMKR